MKSVLLAIFFSLSCGITSLSQTSKLDCRLADLYVHQDIEEYDMYISVIDTLLGRSYSPELHFKKMLVRHIYIAHLLFNDSDNEKIPYHIQILKEDISSLKKHPDYAQHMTAFYATYYGYYAAQQPATALIYLPKSFSYAKKAIGETPNSPYSWTEYANLHYCYALFVHGNFSTAITAFSKAIELFENENNTLRCNWYYINSLLFLAKSYEDNKQFTKANETYNKLLKIRPDYSAIHRWKHKL
ncbi:MAG: hypothetical protein R6U95_04115 [Bacteroidales bacterium]